MKKTLGVIPCRYASTRFPGKPLAMIKGMSMISRVYAQAKKSIFLDHVVIATDDGRIYDHVKTFADVRMTDAHHESGTDRCAELLTHYEWAQVIVNIQGDEPLINPAQIDLLVSAFENRNVRIATLVKKISESGDIDNPNVVKVVMSHAADALYFSRSAIPFLRNAALKSEAQYFKHLGLYGYTRQTLQNIARLPPSFLERMESLEQLRWLENGISIRVLETLEETQAVDVPEDIEKILKLLG